MMFKRMTSRPRFQFSACCFDEGDCEKRREGKGSAEISKCIVAEWQGGRVAEWQSGIRYGSLALDKDRPAMSANLAGRSTRRPTRRPTRQPIFRMVMGEGGGEGYSYLFLLQKKYDRSSFLSWVGFQSKTHNCPLPWLPFAQLSSFSYVSPTLLVSFYGTSALRCGGLPY